MKSAHKQVKIQLIRSLAGQLPNHKACATGLGLRGLNSISTIEDTACNRGMINKISHLVKILEV